MFSFVIFCIGFLQKFVHNSSKVFFGGIKSNIFRKIFDDESSDNAFRWQNYLRTMLNRFSYFKIKSKLTFMYFFIIISDISAIRSKLCFCDNFLHDDAYYDEYCWFFDWELLEQLFFSECKEKAVREYHIFNHFQNRSSYLRPCR